MSQFDVAVIIPTHNRREMVLRSIDALTRQTYPAQRFEVVVMCDGCHDGTYEALTSLTPPFCLRVFTQPQSGVAAARNNAVAQAEAPVVLFIDDDILATPELIAEHRRLHSAAHARVVIGRLVSDPTVTLPGWIRWEQDTWDERYQEFERNAGHVGGRHFYSGNISVDRALFEAVGGFNVAYRRAEDRELGFRLQKAGADFVFNGYAVGIHCGFHAFQPWTQTHYNYGRYDVRLAREEGHADFVNLADWYRKGKLLNRVLVRLAVGRQAIRRPLLTAARAVAIVADHAGLATLSRWSYSAIVNLSYWQGVADELGGTQPLWQLIHNDPEVLT